VPTEHNEGASSHAHRTHPASDQGASDYKRAPGSDARPLRRRAQRRPLSRQILIATAVKLGKRPLPEKPRTSTAQRATTRSTPAAELSVSAPSSAASRSYLRCSRCPMKLHSICGRHQSCFPDHAPSAATRAAKWRRYRSRASSERKSTRAVSGNRDILLC
jgi:hypothetical protein